MGNIDDCGVDGGRERNMKIDESMNRRRLRSPSVKTASQNKMKIICIVFCIVSCVWNCSVSNHPWFLCIDIWFHVSDESTLPKFPVRSIPASTQDLDFTPKL